MLRGLAALAVVAVVAGTARADDLADARAAVDASDYFPGIWQTNVVDQTAYGVPWYVDTRLLFYRSDLLAEAGYADPPSTWVEWIDMLRAIKQRGGPHRYGALLPLNEYEPLLALALQQEAPLLRDGDTRGNFRSEDFKRALRFYREMFDNGFAPATNANQISNVWDEFARGTFAFYITGPWSIGEFKRRLPASLQASWMTAPLPGPEGPGYSVAGGSSLVVFSDSPRKKAAWKFVQYLSQPDVQLRFGGSRVMTLECKNVLRKQRKGFAHVDFMRTRASKSDPCSRFYSPRDFDVVAACLHAVTERWEFRYARASWLEPHKKCAGKLSNAVAIDERWSRPIADVLREASKL